MGASIDPSSHRQAERRFIEHVGRLLADERLRVDTTRGRRPVKQVMQSVKRSDKAVDLKRLMSEMGRPDRQLEAQMPVGETIDIELTQKKWILFRQSIGRVRAVCVSPARSLLAGEAPQPLRKADVEKLLPTLAPTSQSRPTTLVLMSTSGFAIEAHALAERSAARTVILVEPNDAGGFTVHGPAEMSSLNELFDPEADDEKRNRIRDAIEADQMELSGSGVAGDRIAAKTQLSPQLVEAELRSYASENPGLSAKRLDGRLVLFREGSNVVRVAPGGASMPMIDKIKSLFARRGENEKKIAFLSERRAALGQQRDRAYEETSHLEQKDVELRTQFKNASADLTRRRITSQLLQLRKDIERRQQLLGVLNQQINVVSTHLHNLELVQQGQTAKLPDSEEMANDAAAAEEMLATLQESSEMAQSVGGVATSGLSAEEQALYDELSAESGTASAGGVAEKSAAQKTPSRGTSELISTPPTAAKQPPRRNEPEAG